MLPVLTETRCTNPITDECQNAYDRVGYPGYPFGETHPGHLATLGWTTIAERPEASGLARRQTDMTLAVTNLRHRTVSMKGQTVRQLLKLVDGTRTLDQLVTDLDAAIAPNCKSAPGGVARDAVAQNLGLLTKLSLLVA